MAVERYDLNTCIGCRNCINACPMDVFRFDEEKNKSIIAYPENCQACGMCFYVCLGDSLQISLQNHMYPIVPMNATVGIDMNHFVSAAPGLSGKDINDRLGKTGEYEAETKYESGKPISSWG